MMITTSKQEFLLSTDSALLLMESTAMIAYATSAVPIPLYLSFVICASVELSQRIYTALESTKESYGMLVLGRIPRLGVVIYSLKSSKPLGFLFTFLFTVRLVIFAIDYVHAQIINHHRHEDASEKQQNQLKESLQFRNRGLNVKSVDCALFHQAMKNLIPEKNSTVQEYDNVWEDRQKLFNSLNQQVIKNPIPNKNSTVQGNDKTKNSTVENNEKTKEGGEKSVDCSLNHHQVMKTSIPSKISTIQDNERAKDGGEKSVDCSINHHPVMKNPIPNKNSTVEENEKVNEDEDNTEETHKKGEEENIKQCKCEVYTAMLQKVREDYDKLKLDRDSLEKELHKAIQDYNCWLKLYGKQLARLEEERGELIARLKAAGETKSIQGDAKESVYRRVLEEERGLWEEERNILKVKLSSYEEIWCEFQTEYKKMAQGRNEVAAMLHTAAASAEYYRACWNRSEESCRKMREEKAELSAKHLSGTVSAEHFLKHMQELEDKCRRLEEEKSNLSGDLCAAKISAEIYRAYMHDCPS